MELTPALVGLLLVAGGIGLVLFGIWRKLLGG